MADNDNKPTGHFRALSPEPSTNGVRISSAFYCGGKTLPQIKRLSVPVNTAAAKGERRVNSALAARKLADDASP